MSPTSHGGWPQGPTMMTFWDGLLLPLLEVLQPRRVVEVGSDRGTTTRALLEWAEAKGAELHVIDPKPSFDVAELRREHPDALVFHRQLSLEVLPELEEIDIALVDGDHNWYTVLNELRLLERNAVAAKRLPPVVALHDIGWPYGRRDLYYDPDRIPADQRKPFERRGMRPDSDELVEDGINGHLANAKLPAEQHSGVLGAIEDFLAESDLAWELFAVPGHHGLGVLAAADLLEQKGEVADLLQSTARGKFLRRRVEEMERERIALDLRRRKAERAARSAAKTSEDAQEARERLEEAERRERRARRQRDAAEGRESELEDQLLRERRTARMLREDLEGARRRAEDSVARAELSVARAEEAEARRVEAESSAEQEEASRARLLADFEEARESLERKVEELRSQVATGRHGAAELREALEARSLELQRLEAQTLSLRAALGSSRVEAEVARSERAALARRLAELAELHEAAIAELGSPALAPGFEASPAEQEARASFLGSYSSPASAGPDRLALPTPRDSRGILCGPAGERGGDRPSVDIVVCVHDALDDARRCLWSLLERGTYPFHLIVVNDGSSAETTAYLEEVAELAPEIALIHNASPPHGYTIAANLGSRAATADYVVLLNSDTVVTSGWLERIVACGESDEKIGILGPLSNAASHQSVPALRESGNWATNPLPPFATEEGMAKLIDRISTRERPRLPFVNGFCYVVKRPVFEAIGYFDEENFASGYCEENDFSYRAGQAGFELAVADDCYVFHAKSKSYTTETRKPIAKRNYEIFLDKHGAEPIRALVERLEDDTSLAPLRSAAEEALSSRDGFAAALAAGHPLSIDFVLPGLGAGGSGGSHSVYQEVQGLRRLGVEARVLLAESAWQRALDTYEDAEQVFVPFGDLSALVEKTAETDVISATHYKSIALLAGVREQRPGFLPAYYVQDYEPFFSPRGSSNLREALDSYAAIPDCVLFAKTHWLCNIVSARHGVPVAKVEPSLDEAVYFSNADRPQDGPLRVAAMLRPRTPRRQPTVTIAVLEELLGRFGADLEVETFGCTAAEMEQMTGSDALLASHRGVLLRAEVGDLLRRSDVFLDMSIYQAFGRTALEAMACGCTAVVPRLGGAWEFVRDGVNAKAVDTATPWEAVEEIAALVGDRELVRDRQRSARETAARYTVDRAALSEYLVFSLELARRSGAARAAV